MPSLLPLPPTPHQVVQFYSNRELDPAKLPYRLNALLPFDVRARELRQTAPDFIVTASARAKVVAVAVLKQAVTWFVSCFRSSCVLFLCSFMCTFTIQCSYVFFSRVGGRVTCSVLIRFGVGELAGVPAPVEVECQL